MPKNDESYWSESREFNNGKQHSSRSAKGTSNEFIIRRNGMNHRDWDGDPDGDTLDIIYNEDVLEEVSLEERKKIARKARKQLDKAYDQKNKREA